MALWTQNYFHLVFSTKQREPLIDAALATRLYPFMGGIVRDLDCNTLAINGMADHVHLLVRFPSKVSQADLVRHIKSRSCRWVHETFPSLQHFAWQEGGGGFTVSESGVGAVRAYIERQQEHHARTGFAEELAALLRKHNVAVEAADLDI